MKKFILLGIIALCLLITPQASATVECHNFTSNLFYRQDPVKGAFRGHVEALQNILISEGYSIDSADTRARLVGRSTAAAIVRFQQANNLLPVGFVDDETVRFLNQKYGCIEKAVITLTEPNASVVKAKGEILPIKWTASRIPNTATLNIGYTNASGSGLTSIASTTVRNGAGSLLTWRIPNDMTPGTYKIQLSLSGSVKSDISAKPFEVRDNALEMTSPNGGEAYLVGQKVKLQWKSSAAIKAANNIDISLVTNRNGVLSTSTIASKSKNDGSFEWTVPDVFVGNADVSSETSTYRIFISSLGFSDYTNYPGFSIAPGSITSDKNLLVPTCPYTFTKNLSFGAVDKDVIALQNMLKFKGLFVGNSNGAFGATTRTALAAYQASKGISSDGNFGPITRNVATADCSTPLASKIVLTSPLTAQSIGRGSNVTVTWTANSSVPANAKVKILLVKNVGGGTAATLESSVAASAGTATVTIPANTIADAYKIVLVPSGTTFDSSSVLTSAVINVGVLSASITTASTTSSVYKGDILPVAFTTLNVPSTNDVTASVVTSSNGATTVTKVKVKASVGTVNIPIPATLADGSYRVYLSTIVDGQNVTNLTGEFTVAAKPVIAPVITLSTPSSLTIGRGSATTINWTANAGVPAAAKVKILLVKNVGGGTAATLESSVAASAGTATVTIPANTIADAYKIVLVPSGVTLTSTSVLTSPVINVTINTGSFTSVNAPADVYKGDTLPVTFAVSGIPATNDVTASVVTSSNGATTVTKVKVKASVGTVNIPIPATLADGSYRVYLSTIVDGQNVTGTSNTFTLKNGTATMSLVGSPTLTIEKAGAKTSATMLSAVFTFQASAIGNTLTKPDASDFSIVFAKTDGTNLHSPTVSVTVSPNSNIIKGNTATVTVRATVPTSKLSTSGDYIATLSSINTTVGGINSSQSVSHRTPSVNVVK